LPWWPFPPLLLAVELSVVAAEVVAVPASALVAVAVAVVVVLSLPSEPPAPGSELRPVSEPEPEEPEPEPPTVNLVQSSWAPRLEQVSARIGETEGGDTD
jgi:hypothetical protein